VRDYGRERLRVVVVTAFPEDSERPHGGVEAVSVNLVEWLSRLDDLEVHVVTSDPGRTAACCSTWRNATIHRLPRLGSHVLSGAVGVDRRHVSAYVKSISPDLVHAHDFYGLMVKGIAIPRVFTIHGFIYGDTLVSGRRLAWVRALAWRRIETAGWADYPHIISISPYVRERLAGIATGVIHDIDNPIAERFFQIDRRERTGTIFSAAAICRRKNPLALVEAVARLAAAGLHVQLRLAGPVTEADYADRILARVREHGLERHVTFLGELDLEQVAAELSAASVFALVSLEENSPLGIEEAMAAGVPVVASNRCGMPYMVRDGESGFLVDPLDSADVAARLCESLGNDGLRIKMGARAREIARDRFHPERIALRTREVYRRAVRKH